MGSSWRSSHPTPTEGAPAVTTVAGGGTFGPPLLSCLTRPAAAADICSRGRLGAGRFTWGSDWLEVTWGRHLQRKCRCRYSSCRLQEGDELYRLLSHGPNTNLLPGQGQGHRSRRLKNDGLKPAERSRGLENQSDMQAGELVSYALLSFRRPMDCSLTTKSHSHRNQSGMQASASVTHHSH